jgi:pimeloyl-ACP methyl ester carboxylesterase
MARSNLNLLGELWSGAEFLEALARPAENGLPRGDGSGVLLIPGFWGEDTSLSILRHDLMRLGYDVRTWGLGLNNRCGNETVELLLERARRFRARHGRPLAVIGHSRGGLMAREVARRAPEVADLVIALGTPIAGGRLDDQPLPLRAMIQVSRTLFSTRPECFSERCDCEYVTGIGSSMPPGVAAYSLWTRDDGVVVPEDCVMPGEENIEVSGTHIGMVANRDVLKAIAEILARERGFRAEQAG